MPKNRPSQTKTARHRSKSQALAAAQPPGGSEDFPVVGIGASAGGLEACTKLLGALPSDNGMAFILVQHLDPTHESMMAELLAHRTVDDCRAGRQWHAARTRAPLYHSAGQLSLGQQWRPAPLAT